MGKSVEQQIEAAIRSEVDPMVAGVHSVAEDLRDRLDGHERAVQVHQEAQARPPQIVAERDGFYQQYTRALFEEDAHTAAIIQKQRRTAQKQLDRARRDEERARKAVEAATFDRGEVALEATLRARMAASEAAKKLMDAGALLGFRDHPSSGLLGPSLALPGSRGPDLRDYPALGIHQHRTRRAASPKGMNRSGACF